MLFPIKLSGLKKYFQLNFFHAISYLTKSQLYQMLFPVKISGLKKYFQFNFFDAISLDPMPRGIGIEEKQKELFADI